MTGAFSAVGRKVRLREPNAWDDQEQVEATAPFRMGTENDMASCLTTSKGLLKKRGSSQQAITVPFYRSGSRSQRETLGDAEFAPLHSPEESIAMGLVGYITSFLADTAIWTVLAIGVSRYRAKRIKQNGLSQPPRS